MICESDREIAEHRRVCLVFAPGAIWCPAGLGTDLSRTQMDLQGHGVGQPQAGSGADPSLFLGLVTGAGGLSPSGLLIL